MDLKKNKFFKRIVILTLVVFGFFVSGAVFFVFQRSMNMDVQHIRVISLSTEVENEILKTRILINDLILRNDSTILDDLHKNLDTIRTGLEKLNVIFTEEFNKIEGNELIDFSKEYKVISARLSAFEDYIFNEYFRLKDSEPLLFAACTDLSLSYHQFEYYLQRYLYDNTIIYKREIFAVLVLVLLIVLLAGFLIIRLINQLISSDRTLIQKTIEVENRERQRIAADLHDGLGALLSSMIMHFQVLERDYEKTPALIKKVLFLKQLSNQALQTVEEVINNLNPSLLSRFGLIKTLEKIIKEANSLGKTEFSLDYRNLNLKLCLSTEVLLYRICTELINNALKHSDARNAKLTLFNTRKNVHLIYKDNGIGFENENSLYEKGKTGLHNLSSRVESVGGSYRIITEPNQGVEIKISLNLN